MLRRSREGFTLIEMLVVIALILVIAGLGLLVLPRWNTRQKASRGADRLQMWIFVARNTALRDQALRGVRLIPDVNNPLYVTSLVYIEQPDPIVGRPDNLLGGGLQYVANQPTMVQIAVDLTGGQSLPNQYLVQVGDVLQIQGGSSFLIVSPPTAPTAAQPYSIVTVQPTNPLWTGTPPIPPGQSTYNWTITRQPRPTGADALLLPDDVIIDMTLSRPTSSPDPYYDILFSPSGTVQNLLGSSNGKIILWVRDVSQDPDQPGEQSLITVYTRSGVIAAHPVDLTSGNPYSFTLDPRYSGGL
jgi:prepilin-type N-terminal cleavage/methylation domain-containing protein